MHNHKEKLKLQKKIEECIYKGFEWKAGSIRQIITIQGIADSIVNMINAEDNSIGLIFKNQEEVDKTAPIFKKKL